MTQPYYQDDWVSLYHGDCLEVLRDQADASVDSVVTDPPYGLEFMGKDWDSPWKRGDDINADAGMTKTGYTDGRHRLPRPTFTGSTNPKCLVCGGTRRGRRDGTAKVAVCLCLDGGHFPNVRAAEMRAFGQWCELWTAECLRVLKPGGHLLAFGGTRTWHRLACAVEDAGFEIRDSIAWLYGSGFSKGGLLGNRPGVAWCECGENPIPYSHAHYADLPRVRQDVHSLAQSGGKGGDATVLSPVQRRGEGSGVGQARPQGPGGVVAGGRGVSCGEDARGTKPGMGGRVLPGAGQGLPDGAEAGPPEGQGERLRGRAPAGHGGDDRASGHATGGSAPHQPGPGGQPTGELEALPGPHEPLDDGARRGRAECPRCGGLDPAFRGYSTTLKPAFEPVVVARKPLEGTVLSNTTQHGTGALNVDGCRIGTGDDRTSGGATGKRVSADEGYGGAWANADAGSGRPTGGRWPANVVLDESQAAALDEQSGESRSSIGLPRGADSGDGWGMTATGAEYDDLGGASRFFYTAKAGSDERPTHDGTSHPTVKPLALMRWLVRLVTPPGGTVLEPFAGSGTTAEACLLERFHCIAIEREADYLPLILQRINRRRDPIAYLTDTGQDLGLFGGAS